jgi:hypothetical protein
MPNAQASAISTGHLLVIPEPPRFGVRRLVVSRAVTVGGDRDGASACPPPSRPIALGVP